MSETPLDLVRRLTHDAHQAVERVTKEMDVFRSVSTFTQHLQILWHHHLSASQHLANHADLKLCVEQRVTELTHDLVQLGAAAPEATTATEVSTATDDNQTTLPAALGITYVIEGSRLGAHVIAKLLNKNGISTQGLRSVGGEMPDIRQRFQATALRINALSPAQGQEAAEAASQCFNDLLVAYTAWSRQLPNQG